MNVIEFANKYLQPYKVKGQEIIPLHCPYCRGNKKDKETFALNTEKLTFNCKRGKCAVAGTFNQLKKEFGEMKNNMEFMPAPPKEFTRPKTMPKPLSQQVEEYLKKRGFSEETLKKRKVGESNGKIVFPYYEDGEPVLMKFREPGKGGKWIREPGGKEVFWGMEHCGGERLFITEGEFDTLALVEAGIDDVVSVPSGAQSLACVDNCWEWLEGFRHIYIWPDGDSPGQDMCRKLVKKLGEHRCYIVSSQEGHKDANETLYKEGIKGIVSAIDNAREVPVSGLIRMADVKPLDVKNLERVSTGIKALDKVLGGYFMGGLSIWTGENSSGKSTLLGQTGLIEAVDQNYKVCAFSGELPAPMFRYWIDLQAAGPSNLESYYDDFMEEEIYFVPEKLTARIREWYREKFFLHENFGASVEDDILRVFEYASMRYDCRVFVVDNLMTTIFTGTERDFYRQQSNFIGRLKEFAQKFNCHVHVVAHPRKTTGRLTKMDVAGSGEITNRADNVIAVHRVKDDEREELQERLKGSDTIVDIFKNRMMGKQDMCLGLMFDRPSKRFHSQKEGPKKEYGWERRK